MNESTIPPPGGGSHKTMIFLLAGGALLMAAAGIVLFLRSADEPPSEPSPNPEEAVEVAVKPLVSPQRPSSHLFSADTAPAVDTAATQEDTGDEKPRRRIQQAAGTVDAQAVNTYINQRFGQVKACYERRLKVNPFLEGKLDLNIGISPSGKVSAVTVNSDSVRDAEMLSCVKTTIRGWELPKPQGGRVVIAKTFNFKKKDR